MDKRFFLALLLTAIVVVATPLLFPGSLRRSVPPVVVDSSARRNAVPDSVRGASTAPAATAAVSPAIGSTSAPIAATATVETTTVHVLRSTYGISSRGAAPVSVVLDSYPSRRPHTGAARAADLARPHEPLLHYRLALGRDTVALDTVALQPDVRAATAAQPVLTYAGTAAGHAVRVAYQFVPDSFIVRQRTTVDGAPVGSSLLVDLPRTLASNEADSVEDMSHLAVSYRTPRGEVTSVGFGKIDSAETRVASALMGV